jgi:hypothetical protein
VPDTPQALFQPLGDLFMPTELTRTGWVADAQHGGPPSALLARAVERVPAPAPMQEVRITFDLMRVVPMTPLAVRTEIAREGKRIQIVTASLLAEDKEVARATTLRIRRGDFELPAPPPDDWELPTPPDTAPSLRPTDWPTDMRELTRYHLHGVEIRSFDNSFWTAGRGLSWIKLLYPVVAGEEPSPLVRAAAVADIGNGNSSVLDPAEYLFVNPDVTLYLHRHPVGEWIGMDSIARQHATGIGIADTLLFDELGPVGRVTQAQLIEPHG